MQRKMSSNVAPPNRVPDDDPLYSVLDNESSSRYTVPPPLPTSRPHYYEEIDSDHTGLSTAAATGKEYEQPITASTMQTDKKPLNGKKMSSAICYNDT